MKRLASFLLLVAVAGQFPGTAVAQAPPGTGPTLQPPRRPTVSPYLSLIGGNSAAAAYYRQVQPDQRFYATGRELSAVARGLQADIANVQRELRSPPASGLTPTGVPAGFMTHSRFFNRTASGQVGSALPGSFGTYRPTTRFGR